MKVNKMTEAEVQRLKIVQAQDTLEKLVGKEVRLYTEGQPLTQDFVIDRVNIEVDIKTDIAKRVWFG